jgi:hypothetical protein
VPQRLAEVLAIVVAGQGEDGAAVAEERAKCLLQMADGVAEGVGPGQLAEQVAGHEEDIDVLGAAVLGDPLDGAAQIVGAIDSPEAIGEVPVSGVQDPHRLHSDHVDDTIPEQLPSIVPQEGHRDQTQQARKKQSPGNTPGLWASFTGGIDW